MKNLTLIVIIFLSFLAFPAAGDASYLILLKNGGKLTTPRYWSEGNQIKFYIYGGIVGIKKDSIQRIEKAKLVYEGKVLFPEKKPEPVPVKTGYEVDIKTKSALGADAGAEKSPVTDAVKKDDLFIKEFNVLKERFRNIESMTTEELYDFSKDLIGFRDKVYKSRLGHVYVNQIYEIHTIGDEVETVIKSKNQ